MERLTYTYALVKSLYDQGEDYVDSFWPFTIKVFPPHKPVNLEFIQKALKKIFDLRVPLHVLISILNRAKKKGFIAQRRGKYKVTDGGLKYLDKFETDKEVERRINSLFEDIRQSLNKQDGFLGSDQIHDVLLSFLLKNVESLIEFFNSSAIPSEMAVLKPQGYEKYLIEYIKEAEQHKPEIFKTLQDMFLGSIISVVLNAREPSEMIEIRTRKFKHCQVFLDTNFVFYILNLLTPEFNEPAKELFNQLKKHGFEIKVFSFTVAEICWVINGYIREAHRYPTTIAVGTLYSSLKRKGWTKTDAREFIVNIEGILSEKGIIVEWVEDIDLKNYTPPNDKFGYLISKHKPFQALFAQNHDLAAIEKIKELQGHSVRKIEDSKAFFLTSDARLSRFNFLEMGHKESGTVCEVILDRLLTNLLWLKDPSAELSLKSIIAVHSRDLFVKRRVWDRFYEVLRQLKQKGEVKDEDISMLFYHRNIEYELEEFDETDVDEITTEFVLEKIEEASKLPEEEMQRKIKEKEKEFLRRLEEEVSKKEQEEERKWLEKLEGVKKNIRKVAEKLANKRTWVVRVSVMALSAIPSIICLTTKNWDIFNIGGIISVILIFGGISAGFVNKLWGKCEKKWFNKIYDKKIKEVGLNEFEK